MFCVIQELALKKPDKYGHYKELKSDSTTFTINGVTSTKYSYTYGNERFERPVRKAFKVSIHESKRVNGVVTKKQCTVTTASYYDLVDFWIGDCMPTARMDDIADKLETDIDTLWELINARVDPLQEQIKAEYRKTEEYRTHIKHQKIIEKYSKAKARFAKMYDCDASEYDYCYNVFGELMNNEYLNQIISAYRQKSSYQKQSYSNYSNFNWGGFNQDFSGYLNNSSSNYSAKEKEMLKKFYRTLSKEYHPDVTGGSAEEMQLINKLKESWGL